MTLTRLAIPFLIAWLVTAAATPLVGALARRLGLVARPTQDRWHLRPTALLGGTAIFLGTVLAVLSAVWLQYSGSTTHAPGKGWTSMLGIALAASIMFVAGVADDVVTFRPATKLVLQIIAATALVSAGVVLPVTGRLSADTVFTLFWFLAITNALNLLDNMDGVAIGVSGIAASFLAVTFVQQDRWLLAAVCLALAGAAAGFLPYNFHRASIFMGDSGSLFIGALLAGLSAAFPNNVTGSVVSVLFVPALIVIIPIADATLVALTRTLAGRSVAVGGRDHTAHRLVALGLSERQTAGALYGFAAAGGVLALLLQQTADGYSLWLGALFLVLLFTAAAYLSKFHTYPAAEVAASPRFTVLVAQLLYRGRALEVVLDLVLFALGYYGALLLRWDGSPPATQVAALQQTLAIFIAMHLTAFLALGVYRGAWARAGLADCLRVLEGAVAGGILSAAVFVFVFREAEFSRSVLLIAMVLVAVLSIGMRVSFRLIDYYRQDLHQGAPTVLIYGAGSGGELFLSELRLANLRPFEPVAFIDDDPHKRGLLIQGVRVIGSGADICGFAEKRALAGIVVTVADLPSDRFDALRGICTSLGIQLLRFRTSLELIQPARVFVAGTARLNKR